MDQQTFGWMNGWMDAWLDDGGMRESEGEKHFKSDNKPAVYVFVCRKEKLAGSNE